MCNNVICIICIIVYNSIYYICLVWILCDVRGSCYYNYRINCAIQGAVRVITEEIISGISSPMAYDSPRKFGKLYWIHIKASIVTFDSYILIKLHYDRKLHLKLTQWFVPRNLYFNCPWSLIKWILFISIPMLWLFWS